MEKSCGLERNRTVGPPRVVHCSHCRSIPFQAFQNYLLGKTQQTASESLNTPVRIQNLALHFSPLSADLYGVTVRGTESETEPPLLTVDHLKIGFKIVSFD